MIKLDLSMDEANNLAALLDAAVKALGMQGAKAAVVLMYRLEAAVAAAKADDGPIAAP